VAETFSKGLTESDDSRNAARVQVQLCFRRRFEVEKRHSLIIPSCTDFTRGPAFNADRDEGSEWFHHLYGRLQLARCGPRSDRVQHAPAVTSRDRMSHGSHSGHTYKSKR
jgi:hypothetical protein